MQKAIISGNLSKDIQILDLKDGKKMAVTSMAVNISKEEVCWWDIAIFQDMFPRFERLFSFMKKGSKFIVVGDMPAVTEFTDKNGRTHLKYKIYPASIDFASSPKQDGLSIKEELDIEEAPF